MLIKLAKSFLILLSHTYIILGLVHGYVFRRYKSSGIALSVARRYAQLQLPVGVLVIDYHNQV